MTYDEVIKFEKLKSNLSNFSLKLVDSTFSSKSLAGSDMKKNLYILEVMIKFINFR